MERSYFLPAGHQPHTFQPLRAQSSQINIKQYIYIYWKATNWFHVSHQFSIQTIFLSNFILNSFFLNHQTLIDCTKNFYNNLKRLKLEKNINTFFCHLCPFLIIIFYMISLWVGYVVCTILYSQYKYIYFLETHGTMTKSLIIEGSK